jgi:hypothetical protein
MKRLARHTQLFELVARLGVNSFVVVVAMLAMGRLVPHLQTQAGQLEKVSQALDRVEASTSKLQSDFGRYFDPWQAENIMQEQSGYRPPSERQVVWTEDEEATTIPTDDEATPKKDEPAETHGATESIDEGTPAAAESSTSESVD